MKLFFARDKHPKETRVPIIPEHVKKLTASGATVLVEPGIGEAIQVLDSAYEDAGATISTDLNGVDLVLRLNPPSAEDIAALPQGVAHLSYLHPFERIDLLEQLARQQVRAFSIELIPRSTIAQKMDALSSQANLGGYVAVIVAAEQLDKAFPMMMTPAGTLSPAKVFIIGAGVAGLQAIATAKRLGARVEAFDTRPVVEEQVQSLGAKFLKVDLGETGQTEGGYAKQLTEEQLELQRQAMAKACAQADVVITTAQVFGRKAPRIITGEMVSGMKPGSVIVDMAVETGGNVEGSVLDEVVDVNGVRIIGYSNLPGRVPVYASQMYSSNLCHFITHFIDKETGELHLDESDEIVAGAQVTHQGEIVHPLIKERMAR